ncbi:hypothetical protein J4401_02495 [Candidatus Woesearchaeota archaeon]|nr:hypothetical protein [Candidatus Woesearchaeota archaeon]
MSLISRISSGYSGIAVLALACVFCTSHFGAMDYKAAKEYYSESYSKKDYGSLKSTYV